MTGFDRGPLDTYEVVWASGHVERVRAHQVCMPHADFLFGGQGERRWTFHGEFDGHWKLVLTAEDGDIKSVRNVSKTVDDLSAGDHS